MADLKEISAEIIDAINEATADLDLDEKAMVLLYVSEMAKCGIQLGLVDMYRSMRNRKGKE